MWNNTDREEESCGYADTVTDAIYGICGAVIVASIGAIVWRMW